MWPWPQYPLERLGADDHWQLSDPVCRPPDGDALDQVEHMTRRGWKCNMAGPVNMFLRALQHHDVKDVFCDRCTKWHHLSSHTCGGKAHLDRIWEQREQLRSRGVGYAQGRAEFWQWVQLRGGAELGLNHLDGAIAARMSSARSSSCGLRQYTAIPPYSGHASAADVDARDHLAVLHQQPATSVAPSASAYSVTQARVGSEDDVRALVEGISQHIREEFRRGQPSVELCVDVDTVETRWGQPQILTPAAVSPLDPYTLPATRSGPRRGWFPKSCVKKETPMIRVRAEFNGEEYGHGYLVLAAGAQIWQVEHSDADESWAFGVQVLEGTGAEYVQGWYPRAFGVPDSDDALEVVSAFDGGTYGQEYLVLAEGMRIRPVDHREADDHWSYGELLEGAEERPTSVVQVAGG